MGYFDNNNDEKANSGIDWMNLGGNSQEASGNLLSNFGQLQGQSAFTGGSDLSANFSPMDGGGYDMGFGAGPTSAMGGGQTSWYDSAFGDNGWAAPVAGMMQAGGNFYNSYNQNNIAKDSLATQKQQFSDQFNASKQTTNAQIDQRGKVLYNHDPEGQLSPEAYYEKWHV